MANRASLTQALSGGPTAVVEWMYAALHSAADYHDELQRPSQIAELIHIYDHELSLGERELLQRAFQIVLEQFSRGIANDQIQRELPHLLYLGVFIMPNYDPRLRREIGQSARRLIDRSLRSQNLRSALFGINFICDTGLGLDKTSLDSYVDQIGVPAYLPAFMLLSTQDPVEAIPWLLQHSDDIELIINTVRTSIETLCYSQQLSGGSDTLSRTQAWLISQYEEAITTLEDRRLAADLSMALRGKVPQTLYRKEIHPDVGASNESERPHESTDTETIAEIDRAREQGFGNQLTELVGRP